MSVDLVHLGDVKWFRLWFTVLLLGLSAHLARAASTEVSLLLASDTARPGDTVMAGVRLHVKPHWHTYWRNPGGSGIPTRIKWELPSGVTAGDIQWPIPEKLPAEELTTYIYNGDVVLLVPLKIAAHAAAGPLTLKAAVSWLECEKQCVPGNGDAQATLTIGSENKASADAATVAAWQKKLPRSADDTNSREVSGSMPVAGIAAHAEWEKPASGDSRPLILSWLANGDTDYDFYPYSSDNYDVQLTTDTLPGNPARIYIRKTIKKLEGDWPKTIAGLLVQKSGGERVGVEVNSPITEPAGATTLLPPQPLSLMLLYAFLGGLILNVMPCVLPVIALKILGFVNQGGNDPRQVRKLGIVYAIGVLVSFLALAGMVIAVKAAGHKAGWGMQFGNPQFIVVMTVLVTLVALNLFGLFEVNPGGKIMSAAGQLSAKEGTSGAFFNGMLATILATPCTAPYLSYALGFAFAQSYSIIILVFLTVGLGLAAPYLILSWNPLLLRLLPRPGAWMEKFKIAMGFPMMATAVWLLNLTAVHYGRRILWLALFLVVVAMAAWIYGEFVQRGRRRKGLALAIVLLLLLGGYFYTIESRLCWRSPIAEDAVANGTQKEYPDGIEWQPWSEQAVAEARSGGHPVLVDFTADWCQVCQINRNTSIEIARVREKLKELNAVALEADYTKLPANITAELNRFGRAGVPLVLVYPANANAQPEILPDGYLTPRIVLDALDKAAHQTAMN